MKMKPNAERMKAALAFVRGQPGAPMRAVIAHIQQLGREGQLLLSQSASAEIVSKEDTRAYKQARSVVERIIKDRHVRQAADLTLHPWDEKRKAYAEALEGAMFAAPDGVKYRAMTRLACEAWRAAGDESRARTISFLERNRLESPSTLTTHDEAPSLP